LSVGGCAGCRTTKPRDVRTGNSRDVTDEHDGVSLLYCDIITRQMVNYCRRNCSHAHKRHAASTNIFKFCDELIPTLVRNLTLWRLWVQL